MTGGPNADGKPIVVIEAGRSELRYWRDLWRCRELFYFLVWRDILVRYKQTVIGVLWALVRPIVTIVVFSIIFGRLARLPSEGVPYPVLVCAAMLPWQLFASAFAESGNSLVTNANLISKVYFPRLIIPASAAAGSVVDFIISLAVLAVLMMWYGVHPGMRLLAVPVFVSLAIASAMGVGLWVAALNVKYRDFRYLIPFMVQVGFFVSPVGFSSSLIPDKWRLAYSINPMVGVIDGFRWAIFGGDSHLYLPGIALSVVTIAVLLVGGVAFFRKTERFFADVI